MVVSAPTLENLEPVAAAGTGMTRSVIDALQDLPDVERVDLCR